MEVSMKMQREMGTAGANESDELKVRIPTRARAHQCFAGEHCLYSHDGPIRRRMHGYILTADQSDAGCVSIFCAFDAVSRDPMMQAV
eukprot:9491451-Pyramimonas_sp.AAC.1